MTEKIIHWYHQNKRNLPWRESQDPYQIWLSEIILQQTRVKQGLPYYLKFVEKYPSVQDLAQASEEEVLRLWQGLGYYSRARNMHATAQYVVQELQGKFPDNYKDLLKLKGVGKYTAAAIASFAFGEAVAVVDGNVFRVLARLFGIDTDIASSQGHKEFSALAQSLIPQQNPGIYNQAIMEFGALHCSPQKPNCICPVSDECIAFREGRQKDLPVKIKKIKSKTRYFHYLILQDGKKIALKQRNQKDIWQGLYDFFLIEDKAFQSIEKILEHSDLQDIVDNLLIEKESEVFTHVLTHQRVHAKFWHVRFQKKIKKNETLSQELRFYTLEEIHNLPKPVLIVNYLQIFFS